MTLNRRRFLSISAGFACAPVIAQASTWQGRAFGADVSITLNGPTALTAPALEDARVLITEVEHLFSLYDPGSALVRLNRTGRLAHPDPRFLELMQAADEAHGLTGGLFDPTVQPLWQALAHQGDTAAARAMIGWDRVTYGPDAIALERGQALTFNGIAPGFATDLVTDLLRARGLRRVLVNIGEFRGVNGPWRLGLSDPELGIFGHRTLTDAAIATSSPGAMSLGHTSHILHGSATPHWSTVCVEARTATRADSLSTALTMAPLSQIRSLKQQCPDLGPIALVGGNEIRTV